MFLHDWINILEVMLNKLEYAFELHLFVILNVHFERV